MVDNKIKDWVKRTLKDGAKRLIDFQKNFFQVYHGILCCLDTKYLDVGVVHGGFAYRVNHQVIYIHSDASVVISKFVKLVEELDAVEYDNINADEEYNKIIDKYTNI